MPDLILRKTLRALEATDPESEAALRAISFGEWVLVRVKKPRNLKFHRKFFGLLNAVLENQDTYTTVDQLLIAVKVKVGHVDRILIRDTGEVVLIPKSISFANMDEIEFQAFFAAAIFALRELLPDMRLLTEHTLEELEELIDEYAH